MSILYLLITVSIIIAVGFLAAFIWGLRSGQWDDTETPSIRILFDDSKKKKKE